MNPMQRWWDGVVGHSVLGEGYYVTVVPTSGSSVVRCKLRPTRGIVAPQHTSMDVACSEDLNAAACPRQPKNRKQASHASCQACRGTKSDANGSTRDLRWILCRICELLVCFAAHFDILYVQPSGCQIFFIRLGYWCFASSDSIVAIRETVIDRSCELIANLHSHVSCTRSFTWTSSGIRWLLILRLVLKSASSTNASSSSLLELLLVICFGPKPCFHCNELSCWWTRCIENANLLLSVSVELP